MCAFSYLSLLYIHSFCFFKQQKYLLAQIIHSPHDTIDLSHDVKRGIMKLTWNLIGWTFSQTNQTSCYII